MEMNNCDSKAARNEQSRRWYLATSALALLFQLAPPLLFWLISIAAYANPRNLSESWERRISLLTLAGGARGKFFLCSNSPFLVLFFPPPTDIAFFVC